MKNDTTTTFLNFALVILVIAAVGFAVLAMNRTRDSRANAPLAVQANARAMMIQSLINDVNNYCAQTKSPEVTRMLQSLQTNLQSKVTNH
jgi:hypothetical protein